MIEIRVVQPQDNLEIETLIRTCLIEYGGDKEGCAWSDPNLNKFYELYLAPQSIYYVAIDENKVIGGCGIGPMPLAGVCELQKMYVYKEYRGKGISQQLMEKSLDFAKAHYQQCYLETFSNMIEAIHFYKKYDFISLDKPIIETKHFACDRWFIKKIIE